MQSKIKERGLFGLGLLICFSVAAASVLLEQQIPGELLGASIIALFMGTIINRFFHPEWMKPALKFTSKRILKAAIVLLGASLSVSTIMSVGKMTFFVMIFTFAMCFGGASLVRRLFGGCRRFCHDGQAHAHDRHNPNGFGFRIHRDSPKAEGAEGVGQRT